MKDRLKQIRTRLGYSQNQMADKLNVELNTYRGYEYKTKNLPDNILKSLAIIFNVNLNWLYTNKGDMFISNCNNSLELQDNSELIKNLTSFYKRFNQLQKENNLRDFQMSKLLDIHESRIEKLGIGKVLPVFDELNKIKLYFDVSIDWLLYGETPNIKTQNPIEINCQLNTDEVKILKELAQKIIIDNS